METLAQLVERILCCMRMKGKVMGVTAYDVVQALENQKAVLEEVYRLAKEQDARDWMRGLLGPPDAEGPITKVVREALGLPAPDKDVGTTDALSPESTTRLISGDWGRYVMSCSAPMCKPGWAGVWEAIKAWYRDNEPGWAARRMEFSIWLRGDNKLANAQLEIRKEVDSGD